MICTAVTCIYHCFGDENIFLILRSDSDVVNHEPVLRSQVSSEGFELVLLAEQGVCDDQLVAPQVS